MAEPKTMVMEQCPWCRRENVEINMATRRIAAHHDPQTGELCVEPEMEDGNGDGWVWTVGSAGLPTLGRDR